MQLREPGPHVLQCGDVAALRTGQLDACGSRQETDAQGRVGPDPDRGQPVAGATMLAAADQYAYDVQPDLRGTPLQPLVGELHRELVTAVDQGWAAAAELHLCGHDDRLCAHSPGGTPGPHEQPAGGPRRGKSGLGLGEHQGPGERELRLTSALVQAPVTVGASRLPQRSSSLGVESDGDEDLGPVLVTDCLSDRRQWREDGPGGLHVPKRFDEVSAEQAGVAEVVPSLRGFDVLTTGDEVPCGLGEVVGRPGRIALLQEDSASIELGLAEVGR